jgi:hypothetical protein
MKTRCSVCSQEHDVDEDQIGMTAQCFCGKDFIIQPIIETQVFNHDSQPGKIKKNRNQKRKIVPAYDMTKKTITPEIRGERVVISGIDIPFWDLVILMAKGSLVSLMFISIIGLIYGAIVLIILLLLGEGISMLT